MRKPGLKQKYLRGGPLGRTQKDIMAMLPLRPKWWEGWGALKICAPFRSHRIPPRENDTGKGKPLKCLG